MIPEKVLETIKAKASEKHPADREDFCPDDVAGGNIDDGFYSGSDYGEILFARRLLEELGL